jgi:hypothetical protein
MFEAPKFGNDKPPEATTTFLALILSKEVEIVKISF